MQEKWGLRCSSGPALRLGEAECPTPGCPGPGDTEGPCVSCGCRSPERAPWLLAPHTPVFPGQDPSEMLLQRNMATQLSSRGWWGGGVVHSLSLKSFVKMRMGFTPPCTSPDSTLAITGPAIIFSEDLNEGALSLLC